MDTLFERHEMHRFLQALAAPVEPVMAETWMSSGELTGLRQRQQRH
jgi:hypothetical protein